MSSYLNWSPGYPNTYYVKLQQYIPILQQKYKIKAILWHQGESDYNKTSDVYYEYLKKLILQSNKDFGNIPWMIALVSGDFDYTTNSTEPTRIGQKRIIEEGLALQGPDTDALGNEYRQYEGLSSHFNEKGLIAHAQLWHKYILLNFYQSSLKKRYKIYPNPCKEEDEINIVILKEIENINIYNIAGEKIRSIECFNKDISKWV